MIEKEFFLY